MREAIIPISFSTALTDGLEAMSKGIGQVTKEPLLMGIIGTGIAFFVMKKAFRMLKTK